MKFTGYHERTIDSNRRLQIPSQFRVGLVPRTDSNLLYVILGERPRTLSLISVAQFDAISDRAQTEFISTQEALDFEQRFYATARRLEMDKQGRVVLPENLIAKAKLEGDVVLSGAKYRVDIWRKQDYEAFMGEDWESEWPNWQEFLRRPRPESESEAPQASARVTEVS